jgi:hypothetical protein
MPDFHQPDRSDRIEAERELRDDLSHQDLAELRRRARAAGVADVDRLDRDGLITAVRAAQPSQRRDPAWPDAPET